MRMNDTRGSMPFAVIAVTILLVSVAAGAVMAGYERSANNAGGVADDVDVFHLGMVAEKMDVQTGVLSIEDRLFPSGGGVDSRFPDGGGHLPERVVRRRGQLDVPEGGLRAFGGVVEHEVHAFRPLRQGREYQPGDSGGVCEMCVSCGTVRETDSLRIHEGEDALAHPQVHAVAEPRFLT